jgi:hypothetical protein
MNLPKTCEVNRFVAKKKFYEHTNMSETVKNSFINDIVKITWDYKLATDTLNLSKTDNVIEIEIFTINLSNKTIPNSVLKVINKSIPYKILFNLISDNDYCYALIENDTIYNTNWNEEIDFQFNGLNLENVWNNIIKEIIKETDNSSSIDVILDNKNKIDELKNKINKLKNQADREKQFNRQIELDHEIKKLNKELEELLNE